MSKRISSAAQVIEEEQFKLVKEYPAVIRVYENIAGDTLMETVETTEGRVISNGSGNDVPHLPKNRDAAPERIAYLDWLESLGPDVMHSYRKNRKYSLQKGASPSQKRATFARKQAIEQNHKKVEEMRAKGLTVATEGK